MRRRTGSSPWGNPAAVYRALRSSPEVRTTATTCRRPANLGWAVRSSDT